MDGEVHANNLREPKKALEPNVRNLESSIEGSP